MQEALRKITCGAILSQPNTSAPGERALEQIENRDRAIL
jgi:hypothetical protein